MGKYISCASERNAAHQLHVRRGDALHFSGFALPFSHYENILKKHEHDRLYILSDNPDDAFFSLFKKYQPIMIHNDMLEDFCFIRSANRIALALSSYSWWAAFLSDAQEIYFPIPIPCELPWLPLQVPEKRYISIPCYDKYQRNVRENINRAFWLMRRITRHLKNPHKFVSIVISKAAQ